MEALIKEDYFHFQTTFVSTTCKNFMFTKLIMNISVQVNVFYPEGHVGVWFIMNVLCKTCSMCNVCHVPLWLLLTDRRQLCLQRD